MFVLSLNYSLDEMHIHCKKIGSTMIQIQYGRENKQNKIILNKCINEINQN